MDRFNLVRESFMKKARPVEIPDALPSEYFGELVFESCESSMNNYECGSPELIALYRIMRRTEGIYGGRFSGAGFKGACIALVDPAKEDSIRAFVTEEYLKEFPQYKDSFKAFFCHTSNGVDFL